MTKMKVVSRIDPHYEILAELKKPTVTEQLTIIETAPGLIRENLQQAEQPIAWTEKKRQLTEAAEALLPDYTTHTCRFRLNSV
jgi:hypothetical protein